MLDIDKKIAIIGAGRAGSAVTRALSQAGYTISIVASRTPASAASLAAAVKARHTGQNSEVVNCADVILLAVPDRQISKVAAELAATASGYMVGKLVFHMSGSLGLEVLEPVQAQGAQIGSLHPLQSLTGDPGNVQDNPFAGAYIALAGETPVRAYAEGLVRDLGATAFYVPEEQRALYHAAACIASNYLITLLASAAKLLAGSGLTEQQAVAALRPLLVGTIDNAMRLGPAAALTGPISRGDGHTLERHLAAWPAELSASAELYRLLGSYTAQLAAAAGHIDEEQRKTLQQILQW